MFVPEVAVNVVPSLLDTEHVNGPAISGLPVSATLILMYSVLELPIEKMVWAVAPMVPKYTHASINKLSPIGDAFRVSICA